MMSLTTEQEATFPAIIDSILAISDINTITAKRIRTGLQAAVKYDIAPQKDAITQLIMTRFDKFNSERSAAPAPDSSKEPERPLNGYKQHNGSFSKSSPPSASSASPVHKRESSSDEMSDDSDRKPPKKKAKVRTAEDDAKLAARLQAEENGRARPTRGGTTRKRVTTNRTPKKKKHKSASKVKASDDSDIDSSGSEGKAPKAKNGAFHKPLSLSAPLSELLHGETTLSRPQTVKKIWEYIREHDLQDPEDKRQIICDAPMRAIFKQERVHMFTMNKILSTHLYNPDESYVPVA